MMPTFNFARHPQAHFRVRTTSPVDLDTRPYQCELAVGVGRAGRPRGRVVDVQRSLTNAGFTSPIRLTVRWVANGESRCLPPGYDNADLPLAVGLLAAGGHVPREALLSMVVAPSMVTSNGEVLPGPGMLAVARFAARRGYRFVLVPRANEGEAALVRGVTVLSVSHVREIPSCLVRARSRSDASGALWVRVETSPQEAVALPSGLHRAFAAAVIGRLTVLVCGVNATDDASLAEAFAAFLPPIAQEEALDVATLHSLAVRPFPNGRPVRMVSADQVLPALLGSAQRLVPGELSLAHGGVLCLRDVDAFDRRRLQAIQRTVEAGKVWLFAGGMRAMYPAHLQLVATARDADGGRGTAWAGGRQRFDVTVRVGQEPWVSASIPHARIAEAFERRRRRHTRAGEEQQAADDRLVGLGLAEPQHQARLLDIMRALADLDGNEALTKHHLDEALTLHPYLRMIRSAHNHSSTAAHSRRRNTRLDLEALLYPDWLDSIE